MALSMHLDPALPEAGAVSELSDTLNQYTPFSAEDNSSWISVTSEKSPNE